MTLKAWVVPVTPFQQNCSILKCERSGEVAVVDPGGDLHHIDAAIAESGGTLSRIFITHGHLDHAGATAALAQRDGVPIIGPHRDDAFLIESLAEQAERFGWEGVATFEPDRWLEHGDTVELGTLTFHVLHCPGHTPGHVVFYNDAARLACVGDVIFQGSVGRSDLPRGNHEQLVNAIRSRLWPLGEDVQFIPGHGPASTFGYERKTNPFVMDALFDDRPQDAPTRPFG